MLNEFFSGFFAGFLSSLAVVIIYEWLKRPKLSLEIGTTASGTKKLLTGTYSHQFLHVKLINHPQIKFLRWMVPRNPATLCRAWIDFFPDGGTPFAIDARWTTQREPGEYIGLDKLKPDPGLILQIPREDIPAGEFAEINVAVKHQGEAECYAFNNRSYVFGGWKNSDWKMSLGKHKIKARVSSGDIYIEQNFILNNAGNSIEDFKLEKS